jgi:nucleoid DNA-binding protein
MAAKAKKTAPGAKPPTKSELYTSIAEETGLSRKQVGAVFDAFAEEMKKNLGGRGSGKFVVPGLMKVKVIKKPATKARKGINPFTKEETVFKAKPARKVVKVQPMKALKSMV